MLEKNYIDATSFFGHNYVIIMTVFIILPVDFPSKTIGYTSKCIINLNLIIQYIYVKKITLSSWNSHILKKVWKVHNIDKRFKR